MSRIIAVFNQAGGVAKTTLTQNLGYHIAQLGHRVLLIDIDPQAFKQQFSDNWQIRNNLSVVFSRVIDENTSPAAFTPGLVNDRFINIVGLNRDYATDNYSGQADLLGKFNTGSISHQLLIGFDFNRNGAI